MEVKPNAWEHRNVCFEHVHMIDSHSFEKLAESLELREGDRVLDLMSGYGSAGIEIARYGLEQGINGLHFTFLDNALAQINKIKPGSSPLRNFLYRIVLSDAQDFDRLGKPYNKIVLKQGLHELPKSTQLGLVKKIYDSLYPQGIFSLWANLLTPENQSIFQDIIRKKDELAGYTSLVNNRYFFCEDEALEYMRKAGFTDLEVFARFPFRLSTGRFLDADFNGDCDKLNEWNEYIRNRVGNEFRKNVKLEDLDVIINLEFPEGIIRGRKY